MKKSFLQVFKNPILLVIIGLSSAVVSSCTYDKQDKSYGKNSCDTNQLSYVQIQDKFEQQCFACHTASAPSGNVAIYDYPSLNTYITNAKNIFLGSINHTTASLGLCSTWEHFLSFRVYFSGYGCRKYGSTKKRELR